MTLVDLPRRPEVLQLTRQELYDLVWGKPMRQIATEVDCSDVALAKMCRSLRIPVPWRGYWRQLETGGRPRRPPLPASTAGMGTITLPKRRIPAPDEPPGLTALQQRYEADQSHRIVVPDALEDPHPLVARTAKQLRGGRPGQKDYLTPKARSRHPANAGPRGLGLRVTAGTLERALRIMDALLKALPARGIVVLDPPEDRSATRLRVLDEEVELVLEETVRQVERPLTAKEQKERREFPWMYAKPPTVPAPTGQLVLQLAEHSYSWSHSIRVRRSWGDGQKQRVEQCLNHVLVGLVAIAECKKARRAEREAFQQRLREEERVRQEREAAIAREAERVRMIDQELGAWDKAERVRAFVAAARAAVPVGSALSAEREEWLQWASRYADRLDPLTRR